MNLKVLLIAGILAVPCSGTAAIAGGFDWGYQGSVFEVETGDNSYFTVNFTKLSPAMKALGMLKYSDIVEGNEDDDGNVVGKMFVFKKGCAPQPFDVQGAFVPAYQPTKLVLYGAPGIWAKDGCRIVGFDSKAAKTPIVFTFLDNYDPES